MIQAGDVVVCVAGDCGGSAHRGQPPSQLVVGRCYTVAGFTPPELFGGGCVGGLIVAEMPIDCERDSGFCLNRFRKIDKADEQFTRQVRACKPIKQREDA